MERSLYEIVGEEGFERLTQAFYAQVPGDEILGPMYPPEQMEAARVRLHGFLVGRFGGPQRYVQQRGHPRLRMRHMPFPIDGRVRDRWMELMTKALDDAGFEPDVADILVRYLSDTATFMINRAR